MKKKLLVLDLNGVLCRKVSRELEEAELFIGGSSYAFRPHCREFVTECLRRYEVAVYSSTTERVASRILERLFTDEERARLLFVWYRDRTSLDPDYLMPRFDYSPSWRRMKRERIFPHSTVKYLSTIFDSPDVNEARRWNLRNVVICDDSIMKMRYNAKKNCIIVKEYTCQDNELLTLMDRIEERFSQL